MYHDFKDYLAALLAQPGIEEMVDQACDEAFAASHDPPPDSMYGVFDSPFVRSFAAPGSNETRKLFIDRGGEIRLLFSLNVDFFNPETMAIRGPSLSCGIISMACLNLKPGIRYKTEYMYLAGVIPGPREPSSTALNHYLRPLMDDLVIAFERGIHFSRTSLSHSGRICRSAVAIAVNDLPAARKLAQFASHSSHFYCTVCDCYHRSTRGHTEFQKWNRLDATDLREYAIRWRDASTSKEQQRLFDKHGVRWSELWRLSYWDPSRQLVVDSMHCLLEGLLAHNFRDLLGLTSVGAAKGAAIPAFHYPFRTIEEDSDNDITLTTTQAKQITSIHVLLLKAIVDFNPDDIEDSIESHLLEVQKKMEKYSIPALRFVCVDLQCLPSRSGPIFKRDYISNLVSWVSN